MWKESNMIDFNDNDVNDTMFNSTLHFTKLRTVDPLWMLQTVLRWQERQAHSICPKDGTGVSLDMKFSMVDIYRNMINTYKVKRIWFEFSLTCILITVLQVVNPILMFLIFVKKLVGICRASFHVNVSNRYCYIFQAYLLDKYWR